MDITRYKIVHMHDPLETSGVNDRLQLADAEAELRRRTNAQLGRNGVTMLDRIRTLPFLVCVIFQFALIPICWLC